MNASKLEIVLKKDPYKFGSKIGKTKSFKKYGRVFWTLNKRELHIIPNDEGASLRRILQIIRSRQNHCNISYAVIQHNGDGEAPKIIMNG